MSNKFPSGRKQISINKYLRLQKRGICCKTTRWNLNRYFLVEKAIDSFLIDDYLYARFFNRNTRFGVNVTHCIRYKIDGKSDMKGHIVYYKRQV